MSILILLEKLRKRSADCDRQGFEHAGLSLRELDVIIEGMEKQQAELLQFRRIHMDQWLSGESFYKATATKEGHTITHIPLERICILPETQTVPKSFTVTSIINRLQGIYPIGPIGENGEPEFGWESRSGTMSDVHIPTPLMLEASHVINTMNDEIAQRDEELEDMRLSWIPEDVVRELCVSVNAFRDVCEAMASGHKVDYEQVKADINTAVYKIFPLCEVLAPE